LGSASARTPRTGPGTPRYRTPESPPGLERDVEGAACRRPRSRFLKLSDRLVVLVLVEPSRREVQPNCHLDCSFPFKFARSGAGQPNPKGAPSRQQPGQLPPSTSTRLASAPASSIRAERATPSARCPLGTICDTDRGTVERPSADDSCCSKATSTSCAFAFSGTRSRRRASQRSPACWRSATGLAVT
jgi:hypothetical protein